MVKPAARRQAAQLLISSRAVGQRRACRLVRLSRSVLTYRPRPNQDEQLRARLRELARQHSDYGFRMLHAVLRGEGLVVNHKRTYRIYRGEGLQLPRRRKDKRASRPSRSLPLPDGPNQRWSMDFVHDRLAYGRAFRVLNVIDDFNRECVGQLVAHSIGGARVARLLTKIGQTRPLPDTIVSDNGPEFRGTAMHEWAGKNHVALHFIEPGEPTQNAFVESFNGTFRTGCLNQHWFRDLAEARQLIDLWRYQYNHERPHSSLNYLTPMAYKEQAA